MSSSNDSKDIQELHKIINEYACDKTGRYDLKHGQVLNTKHADRGTLYGTMWKNSQSKLTSFIGSNSNYELLGNHVLDSNRSAMLQMTGAIDEMHPDNDHVNQDFLTRIVSYFAAEKYVFHYFNFFDSDDPAVAIRRKLIDIELTPETFEMGTGSGLVNFDIEVVTGLSMPKYKQQDDSSERLNNRSCFLKENSLWLAGTKMYKQMSISDNNGNVLGTEYRDICSPDINLVESVTRYSLGWSKAQIMIAIHDGLGRLPTYADIGIDRWQRITTEDDTDTDHCESKVLPGFNVGMYSQGVDAWKKYLLRTTSCSSYMSIGYIRSVYRLIFRVHDHWDWDAIRDDRLYSDVYIKWVGDFIYRLPFTDTQSRDEIIDAIKLTIARFD